MTLGGVDIGTTGCKCTLMTVDGKYLSSCYREYAVSRTAGTHEMDPAMVWDAVKTVIRGACAETDEKVEAICITSIGESCALLDENGTTLGPILLYTDPRGEEECAELNAVLGEKRIYEISGHRPNPMYFLPKLMWFKKNKPDIYERIGQILPVNSYIAYQLCGGYGTDTSLAARTMMLDIRKRDWSEEILAAGGIDRKILPPVVESGTALGTIKADLVEELGVTPDTKVVIGCHDQVAAAIGAGALLPGMAVNGSGTVECVTPVFESIPDALELFDSGYAIVPVPEQRYVTYAFIFTGGALLTWYRDNFAGELKLRAKEEGKSIYAMLDESVKAEPSGLLLLPHFAGAATPYMDTAAKGALYGLSLENDAADVYQALLEGVTYEMRVNLELLEAAGIRVDSLRATGGGSRSKIWLQIKSDVLGKPIETITVDEAGTIGSILLAGLAVGAYTSLDEAMKMIGTRTKIEPAADRDRYNGIFCKYRKLYSALKQIEEENEL